MKMPLGHAFLFGLLALSLFSVNAAAQAPSTCDVVKCPATVPSETTPAKVGVAKVVPQPPAKPPAPGFFDQVGAFFGDVGSGIAAGTGAVGKAISATFFGIGGLLVAALSPLAALLARGQPSWMGAPLYGGVVSTGVAGVAGASQAGAWYGWKKLFPLGMGLPLFSRIDKDELLEHDRRARIFELIKTNPGIHLSEIARELDYAWGTTLHHLRKLRADHLIMFKELGHHKSFFINGSGYSEKQMEAMSLIKNGTLSKLASYLEEHPRVSLKELSEALSISPPLAAFHIRKLEKAGLVQKVRDGKSVRLSIAQALPLGFLKNMQATTPVPSAPLEAAS